jgi:hypothetical protein
VLQERRAGGSLLGERPARGARAGEVTKEGLDNGVPWRDDSENVLETFSARPPELVGIAWYDPLGSMFGNRKPSELGHRARRPTNEAALLIALEHLERGVTRRGDVRDDDVDARVQMETIPTLPRSR